MHRRDFDKRADGENAKLPDALHGDFDPSLKIQRERPEHRRMIDLSVSGYSITEVAAATGYSRATVSNILRQPWAREYQINQSQKTVQDEIKAILEREAIPSIHRLVQIRDSSQETAADKSAA